MVALDAMGGDFAPHATVQGAIDAARLGIPITLYGDQGQLVSLCNSFSPDWRSLSLTIHHCSEVIGMGQEPGRAVLKYKDSSLVRAVQAPPDKRASVVLTAGNSGAALVAGSLILKRIDGILRPALGNFLPTQRGSLFCIDLGANTDCKPEYLEQFALMGHLYVQKMKKIARPRVALLCNGAEPYKGSLLVKQAYVRLLNHPVINFVGNLEARDIFDNHADVLVCDGFVGNVMLKAAQGTARLMTQWMKMEAAESWRNKLALLLGAPMFRRMKEKTDYASAGGALLLGARYPLVVAHGCSSAAAITKAISFAHEMVGSRLIGLFNQELELLVHQLSGFARHDEEQTLQRNT